MQKIEKFVSKFYLPLIFVFSIGAIWALTVPGFYGASDEVHIAWLYEMDYVVRNFQIPPRYVPDLSFGFGYPLFNFVFPLPYYIGELFHLIGFSLVDSVKLVFGLSVVLSMIGMYVLMRRLSPLLISLAAAVVYGYAPYRAADIYIRGAIGELVALAFMPWIVWSIIKMTDQVLSKNQRLQLSLLGGLFLAGFILSHNIACRA